MKSDSEREMWGGGAGADGSQHGQHGGWAGHAAPGAWQHHQHQHHQQQAPGAGPHPGMQSVAGPSYLVNVSSTSYQRLVNGLGDVLS